ncbi:MAG: beta-galactosidase, partial [Anaerolineae bacterium]
MPITPPESVPIHNSQFSIHNLQFQTAVRLLFLTLLLPWLQPPPLLITPGPPQTVNTSHPALGVHTRLIDEVEEWKIQRTLQMTREMGAAWIVEFFPWAYAQPSPDRYDWAQFDRIISHAQAQGLQVVARIGLTPDWARPSNTPLTYLDQTAYDDFADFAADFAGRYAGQVSHLIVGNEPNLNFEWGYRQTTPADYAALLQAVYPAVKTANPGMMVLAGALAPTLEPAGSANGLNELDYLTGLYDAGAADFFDGLAAHTYGRTFPPAAEPGTDRLNFRRLELQMGIMAAFGDGDKPIFITETGWNDHPRWTQAVRPGQRIRYTLDAIQFAEDNWPTVQMAAIWVFRTPATEGKHNDYYTLVTPEFVA